MSWFDASGLASLAKTALKEAQKQIDKALDIQEDDEMNIKTDSSAKSDIIISGGGSSSSSGGLKPKLIPTLATNDWDSFNDGNAFFENPPNEMVTTPPKSNSTQGPVDVISSDQMTTTKATSSKRESIYSNSDSVELLSTPSGLTSPSIDIITSAPASSPESVEIISPEEIILDDDDDSMSYNTVLDDTLVIIPDTLKTTADQIQSIFTDSTDSVKTLVQNTTKTNQLIIALSGEQTQFTSTDRMSESDKASELNESQTTDSFENVQLPTSEKSLVKLGSIITNESSGHQSDPPSADEIETTTSSDIEIISNPNGDSSCSSRMSPGKFVVCKDINKYGTQKQNFSVAKPKGHYRDNSEVSIKSEDSQSEMDKLMRRISELGEILEQREIRLLDVSRQNSSLVEKNAEIQKLLDAKYDNDSEENTLRLSALEKKFQSTIRERDLLREQLNAIAAKIPKDDQMKLISEKDFMIEELRVEGEKLSKQVLQHSNILKKLRTKEKESDSILKKNKEQIENLTEEVERLKKSLAAKEEVERSQIDAVHKLSSAKRKMEKENLANRGQIEDLTSKLEAIQTSFDATKKELQEKEKNQQELSKKANALATIETEKKNTQLQNVEILCQLDELRFKLKACDNESSQREQKLRRENLELLRRLEESEIRSEELTREVTLATVPLVRQLESLQNTLTTRSLAWEKQEAYLSTELNVAQKNLEKLKNIEDQSYEQQNQLNVKIKNLEDRLQNSLLKCEELNSLLQKKEFEFTMKESDYTRNTSDMEIEIQKFHKNQNVLTEKISSLEEKLDIQQKNHTIVIEQMSGNKLDTCNRLEANEDLGQNSPTLSLRQNSLTESLNSSAWQMEDLDIISSSAPKALDSTLAAASFVMSNSQLGHSTVMLENLQSTLKQKEGEMSQLQWELSRLNSERNALNSEISNLTLELENIKEKYSIHESMENEFFELKNEYDALLQMYGEKVEETQELELDLQDVKEMYKAQIDELLKQQKQFLSK